jgi:glycosyltransferase involved in cell wall biosynthesis
LTSREFKRDDSLEKEFGVSGTERHPIADPQPVELRRTLERLRLFSTYRAVFYWRWWEIYRFWAMAAARQIVEDHRHRPFDLIYASAGPYSSLEAAAWAARRLERPWVADLRDLWTRDSLRFYPSRLHFALESRLERRILSSAAVIIANTPGSASRLRDWLPGHAARRVAVIPNGFGGDRRSEIAAQRQMPALHDGKKITIAYAGTLYDPVIAKSRLGRYRPVPLNQEARSILPLLRGLSRLKSSNPAVASRFRVRILGYAPEETEDLVAQHGLIEMVAIEGVKPRAVAAEAVRTADVLLVQQVAFMNADRPVPYVPGKVYEYLSTGMPILAPIGPGDLAELLRRVPHAYVCDYRKPEAVADALLSLLADLDRSSFTETDLTWLSGFHRENLTCRLAKMFDEVLS